MLALLRKFGGASLVVCVTAGLLLVPEAASAAPRLSLSRTSVIAGESVTVAGTVGTRGKRPVQLQKRIRGDWVRAAAGKTTSTGRFSFQYRTPASPPAGISLRVVARAAKVGPRRLRAVVTRPRTVRTVATSARIASPSSAYSTLTTNVTGTFSPARPGRRTEVQRRDGSAWITVGSGTQDRTGTTKFVVGPGDPGPRQLRVRTLAAAGAAESLSALQTVTLLPTPAGPTGVSVLSGDAEAIVTWDPSDAGDLDGYNLYQAESVEGPWTLLTEKPLHRTHEGTFTVGGLTNGTAYAFAVTTTRTPGVESTRSVSELVTPKAVFVPPDCGPPVGTWTCTMGENFDGITYDKKLWFPQHVFATGSQDAFACYRNTPETVSVGGGLLSLSVVRVEEPVSCKFAGFSGPTNYIAGGLMSYQRFTQQYGRIEARIRTQETEYPGLQESFWMWPDDRVPSPDIWPDAGEIDISETYSSNPTLSIPFLHYRLDASGGVPGVNTAYNCTANRGAWNTYTMVWRADWIWIYVNGTLCLANGSGDNAFQKPYMLLFTAALGAGPNKYDGRAQLPATMQVDYVRAWQ